MQAMESRQGISYYPRPDGDKAPVMALHCSGADHTQWQHLAQRLDQGVHLICPNLAGPEAFAAGWSMTTYALAEEAKPLIARLRQRSVPAHLVGHSYGGAVALHIARNHPELVASLCLYEPTMFSLLNRSAPDDLAMFEEIRTLANSISDAISEDCPGFAAQVFTDFWGGHGAWQGLRRDRRAALTGWISKCPLDFGALLFEPTAAFWRIRQPTTLIVGTQTHRQTWRIGELLAAEIAGARLVEVTGAGHLGPFTFRDAMAELVEGHLRAVNADHLVRTPSCGDP